MSAAQQITTSGIYVLIRDERVRAHLKHGAKSMESANWDDMKRLRILLEEVGEIAKVFNELDAGAIDAPEAMRQCSVEAMQVAAMAAAWSDAASRALADRELPGEAPGAEGAGDPVSVLRAVRAAAQRESACDLQSGYDHGRRAAARMILELIGAEDA